MLNDRSNLKRNKIHLKCLTSLRFFAVMLIVFHHLRLEFRPPLLKSSNFENGGIIGVTFFLFLSGFVITLNYSNFYIMKESLYFLWNRIIRIYPVHIFTFFLSLIIIYMSNQPVKISTAIINLLLLQSYFPSQGIFFSFNYVSWILSTLFFFYIVFSFINHKLKYFGVIILISLFCLMISMVYIEMNQEANKLWLLYIFPPNRLLVFLFGVGACKLFYKFRNSKENWGSKLLATLLEIICLLLIIDFIVWGNLTRFLNNVFLFINFPFKKSIDLFNKHYIATTIPTFLILITFGFEKGYISRFLAKQFFVFLGEISFSIFMFHQLFFRFLRFYKKVLFNTFSQYAIIIIVVIAVIPLSILIYKFIEAPLRRKLRIDSVKATLIQCCINDK